MSRWIGVLILVLAACSADPSPTPSPTATAAPQATDSAVPSPSPTPEPALSLDVPEETDDRVVSVVLTPEAERIVISVTSHAEERIDELVLRWPTDLDEVLFLAPFVPSEDRVDADSGPLVQDWTKWVVGPGERGEPAGTTSLGYGPLLPGATLQIPLFITRNAEGPVAFDLLVLADNAVLRLEDGAPAWLRVEIP